MVDMFLSKGALYEPLVYNGKEKDREIVQFVQYRQFQNNHQQLAEETLMVHGTRTLKLRKLMSNSQLLHYIIGRTMSTNIIHGLSWNSPKPNPLPKPTAFL